MLPLLLLYGLLALLREFSCVKYFNSVYAGSAFKAAILGFEIGCLDSIALVIVFERIVSGWGLKSLIPLLVYEGFGAVGTFIGVQHGKYRDL